MEFSGQELEDLQRAAGLLGLTVDELITHGRRSAPATSPLLGGHYHEPQVDSSSEPYQAVLRQYARAYSDPSDQDSLGFDDPWAAADQAAAPTQTPAAPEQTLDTEVVVLLNPQTAWYDCNRGMFDYFEEVSPDPSAHLDSSPEGDGPDSFVEVAQDSDDEGEATAREGGKGSILNDSGTEWSMVPSSPGSTSPVRVALAHGPGASSRKRRYQPIAPRPGSGSQGRSSGVSSTSSNKVRKKRSPYQDSKKVDTNLTRQLNACVRCRMQRNRCIPDPDNPRGPCKTCQAKNARMSRLPCLRYKITDSTLFRTGLDYMPFYKTHPMIGPHYGDFHLDRMWTGAPSKILCFGQLGSSNFQLEVEEFVPDSTQNGVDLKGRPIFAAPWAISDPDAAVAAINQYLDDTTGLYMDAYLDDSDPLVWDVFHAAYRASVFPYPNKMLQKTIRLWVACRFIESRWRCWGDDAIAAANPQDPFYEWESPPPYLDYQLASIIIHRILGPLREEVLRDLQAVVNEHRPQDWYITFLTSFILLLNYEMQILFQLQFAARREAAVRYLDMPLVRATNSGAKTILAHFHYCCKGQRPFRQDFDWHAPKTRRMARLDSEQNNFMASYSDLVARKASSFEGLNGSHAYHRRYWYTSQLFDPEWVPPETLEHSPPADSGL